MPEFVDSTVNEIDARLRELNDERSRLEAARLALTGGRRRPGRPAATTVRTTTRTTSRAGRGRARRGTASSTRTARSRTTRTRSPRTGGSRATQVLELIRKQPGITIGELAKAMRIQPNYLYRVVPRLAADGQVKRDGQGWHPAT